MQPIRAHLSLMVWDFSGIVADLERGLRRTSKRNKMTDERGECLKIPVTEKELQYRSEKYANVEDVLKQSLKCTVCSTDLSGQVSVRYSCRLHIILQVLICKKCKEFYGNGYLSHEEDGSPKYCRWCGDGGDLFLCDRCDSGFCKKCVRRNFPRSYSRKLGNTERWTCFVCAPDVLYDLRATAWAARKLCKKRREEEREKGERKGKRGRRAELSSLETSLASTMQGSPTKQQSRNLPEHSKNAANPTDLTKVKSVENPVLQQAKYELQNFYCQLRRLHDSDRLVKIAYELSGDASCDSFGAIEQWELLMQDYIIALIDDLNRFSTDLSSRLAQLHRLYLEDCARASGGGFAGDCTEQTPDKVAEETETSDQDDVISLSSRLSEDSVFSSVSNSRNNRENRVVENHRENDSDIDDATTTGFSLANLGATSTPSKDEGKTWKVEFIKKEVVDGSPRREDVAEEDEKEEEEEEEKEKNDRQRSFSQDEYVLKLLEDDAVSDDDEEEGLGEERVASEEAEEEEEEEIELGLGEESPESEEGEEDEVGDGLGEESVVESEEEMGETVVEQNVEEVPEKKKREEGKEREEEGENKENDNVNSVETNEEIGEGNDELDEETVTNEKRVEEEMNADKTELGNSNNLDVAAPVEDCQELIDEKKTASSDNETDFSQNDNERTTVVENPKSGADSDASTEFEVGHDAPSSENKEKMYYYDTISFFFLHRKLAYLGALDRKRKKTTFYSTSEESESDKSEKRSTKKKAKKSEEKYDILDNLNNDSQEVIQTKTVLVLEAKSGSPKKRPSWKRDDLLTGKLSSSDEDDGKAAAERRRERREKRKMKKKERKSKPMFMESVSESGDISDGTKSSDDDDDDDCKMLSNSGSDSSIQFVMSKNKRSRKTSSSGSIHSISSINDNDDELRMNRKTSKIWRKKKRIKINLDDSSQSGSSCEEVDNVLNTSSQSQGLSGQGRRNIRKVMKDEDVALATKKAIREEEERKQRVLDRQQKINDSFGISDGSAPIVENRLVLDFDTKTKKELICVDEDLVAQMKPHQVEGVKFMWDACFESLEAIKDGEGGGCILAHCMGLGKTFQVVSLVHTLLMYRSETRVRRVLICCPLTTVLNWYSEFQKWLAKMPLTKRIALHHLANDKTIKRRVSRLQSWHENGGVMIMGYEMFRSLTNDDKKVVKSNYKEVFTKTLLKPGADLVICDEGHTLKNLKTALSKQMNKIQTKRRIVLTGTPLQNNLIEYHCMMNFVKPNYLGTKTEFINRFVNPITNGQFADSIEHDIKVMKRRAHVLHKMLDGITQRRDYNQLTRYLPPKQEYVISIRLTELQVGLMKTFLEKVVVQKRLFKDYQSLCRLWSHPLTLKYSIERSRKKPDGKLGDIETAFNFNEHSNDSDVQFVPNCNDDVTVTDNAAAAATDKTKDDEEKTKEGEVGGGGAENSEKEKEEEWWKNLVTEEQMNDVTVSSKLVLLFGFLKQCATIGDKVLIFSQSLASLDVIEYFLGKLDQCHASDKEAVQGTTSWKKDVDYFRLDGSTSGDFREKWTKAFNNPSNRSRLFLISTRAGGMGINLTAANRVILFDASWNPSNDIQSIFRVFRFGQDKPCYIYRFIAQGTMEEKIYDRQINKLSLSIRVVDEQQVNRYYSQTDLQALYKFTPASPDDRPVTIVPKDRVLCEILEEHRALIYNVFEHNSLLAHVEEEELDEAEQLAAWEDYKNEKKNALSIDRIQAVQSIPAEDAEMLMKMTIPAEDVELMERMLMSKYGHTIPSEKLKEILKIELDLWKRQRVSERTGGPSAAGPATSTNRPTPAIASSRPILPRNQYSTVRPATSNAATSTSRFVPNINAPSTSRNTQPSNRYASNSTSTSSLVASSDANSIYRPVPANNAPPHGKQCPVCTLINDVGVNRCNACNTNLATQTNRPTSANKAVTATETSLKISISRPTSTSNAVTAASRPVPASNANPPNGHVPGMTFPKTLLPLSNANPSIRPVSASNNKIPTSRPPSTSNAVTAASRPVPASNANPPNRPASNAVKASDSTISSNNLPSTSAGITARKES
ncbi:hypothetical protein LSTR_LSTR008785 [Laodelphax striatellus]|uniref:ATP-dependent helicase ATRX n=1 Tax=Laodelphax striatellus TaxID=195883 RepID=A0A482X374_LAOST|nr:hypothetical protein LSTR_LSTR008785 [Laodelphax striatellus]